MGSELDSKKYSDATKDEDDASSSRASLISSDESTDTENNIDRSFGRSFEMGSAKRSEQASPRLRKSVSKERSRVYMDGLIPESNVPFNRLQRNSSNEGQILESDLPKKEHPLQNISLRDGTAFNLQNTLVIGCLIFVFVSLYLLYNFYGSLSQSTLNPMEVFKASLNKIESNFIKQNSQTWKVIKAAVNAVDKIKDKPSVLLIAPSKNAENAMDCLLSNILRSLSKSLYVNESVKSSLDGRELSMKAVNEGKVKIQNFIEDNLSSKDNHVLVFDNFEKIPGKASQMLHTYCDHENAPYKDVIIVLVVREEMTGYGANVDKIVSDYLLQTWGDLKIDASTSLLSRIANRVVIVEKEDILPDSCT